VSQDVVEFRRVEHEFTLDIHRSGDPSTRRSGVGYIDTSTTEGTSFVVVIVFFVFMRISTHKVRFVRYRWTEEYIPCKIIL
jgi:hypothetical protein